MKNAIPVIAVFGLIVVASLPAPGFIGVTVGGICVLVILGWAIAAALSSFADMILARLARRKRARQYHAGSGVAKKVA